MADPMGLDVQDVVIKDVAGADAAGKLIVMEQVTFKIGTHGPFTLQFPAATVTSKQVADAMNAKVALIRSVINPQQYPPM